jgi:hypothetical protein
MAQVFDMPWRRLGVLLLATATLIAVWAVAGAGRASAGASDPGAGNLLGWASEPARGLVHECSPQPDTLSPGGKFSAIYRVQRPYDVEQLGVKAADTPAQFPLKDRDLVMVRARGNNAQWADDMVSRLSDLSLLSGEMFDCNRIISMTGVRADGSVPKEYAYKLANDQRVWGVVPDWERLTWHFAYGSSTPYWSGDYNKNISRISQRVDAIDSYRKKSGVVVTGWRHRGPNAWNYGGLQKRSGIDLQIIQLQEECQYSPSRVADRITRIKHQYRMAGVPLSKLAIEVSFAKNPGSTALPHDVVPSRAASCVRAGYAKGIHAWLLWAGPSDLDEFYAALPDYIRK